VAHPTSWPVGTPKTLHIGVKQTPQDVDHLPLSSEALSHSPNVPQWHGALSEGLPVFYISFYHIMCIHESLILKNDQITQFFLQPLSF
jgi:hypothetical protein